MWLRVAPWRPAGSLFLLSLHHRANLCQFREDLQQCNHLEIPACQDGPLSWRKFLAPEINLTQSKAPKHPPMRRTRNCRLASKPAADVLQASKTA